MNISCCVLESQVGIGQAFKIVPPFRWEFLQKTCAQYPIILDLECSHEEVEAVLSTLNPAGLNLTGDEEEKVGFKSFDELDEILDRLEVEE